MSKLLDKVVKFLSKNRAKQGHNDFPSAIKERPPAPTVDHLVAAKRRYNWFILEAETFNATPPVYLSSV